MLQKSAGPLFSDVVSAVSSTAEDEAAESVSEPELPEASEETETEEPAAEAEAEAEAALAEKQRLTVFVGNLPFRKFTCCCGSFSSYSYTGKGVFRISQTSHAYITLSMSPTETTDSEVRDLFAEFGTVELISVPRNRETGQARGFAFVDMATREDLDKALEGVNGIMYGGRTLRAAESLPKEEVKRQERPPKTVGTCVQCV